MLSRLNCWQMFAYLYSPRGNNENLSNCLRTRAHIFAHGVLVHVVVEYQMNMHALRHCLCCWWTRIRCRRAPLQIRAGRVVILWCVAHKSYISNNSLRASVDGRAGDDSTASVFGDNMQSALWSSALCVRFTHHSRLARLRVSCVHDDKYAG